MLALEEVYFHNRFRFVYCLPQVSPTPVSSQSFLPFAFELENTDLHMYAVLPAR